MFIPVWIIAVVSVLLFLLFVTLGILLMKSKKQFETAAQKLGQLESEAAEAENKYEKAKLDENVSTQYLEKLLKIMDEEKPYLDSTLTIQDLADKLNISHLYLSQIINMHMNMNFNLFINMYRVNTIKELLAEPKFKDKTIINIAFESGFYSKSAFNSAFKKFTGMTPSQYRKKYLDDAVEEDYDDSDD